MQHLRLQQPLLTWPERVWRKETLRASGLQEEPMANVVSCPEGQPTCRVSFNSRMLRAFASKVMNALAYAFYRCLTAAVRSGGGIASEALPCCMSVVYLRP